LFVKASISQLFLIARIIDAGRHLLSNTFLPANVVYANNRSSETSNFHETARPCI